MRTHTEKFTSSVVAISERLESRRLFTVSTFYVRADPTPGEVDEWVNASTPGSGTPTTVLPSVPPGITVPGASTGVFAWIDESAGPVTQSGTTIHINGSSGSVSSNSVLLIGTTGNDTIVGTSSNFSFGSQTIAFTNLGFGYVNPNGGSDSLSITSGETILAAGGSGITARQFSTLSISSGAELYVQPPGSHSLRSVLLAPSGVNISGKLDLTSNDMIVTGGNYGGLTGNIHNAVNLTTSATSIVTSAGTAPTALGLKPQSSGSFDGISIGSSSIVIKWTFEGDTQLDGIVNGSDYTEYDNGFNTGATGWINGDFNYDGVINSADGTLIDAGFNNEGTTTL